MAQQMSKQEIGKAMEKFAAAYPGHTLALIPAPESKINQISGLLNVGQMAPTLKNKRKVAYLVVPEQAEGELADSDIERVAGGLGDKYEANCESTLALGTSSMVVLNIA
jgi:hypothetical protein